MSTSVSTLVTVNNNHEQRLTQLSLTRLRLGSKKKRTVSSYQPHAVMITMSLLSSRCFHQGLNAFNHRRRVGVDAFSEEGTIKKLFDDGVTDLWVALELTR